MSRLDDYRRRYQEETGDARPDPPKRMLVRRYPTTYTAAGRRYVDDDMQWTKRFLDWLVEQDNEKEH